MQTMTKLLYLLPQFLAPGEMNVGQSSGPGAASSGAWAIPQFCDEAKGNVCLFALNAQIRSDHLQKSGRRSCAQIQHVTWAPTIGSALVDNANAALHKGLHPEERFQMGVGNDHSERVPCELDMPFAINEAGNVGQIHGRNGVQVHSGVSPYYQTDRTALGYAGGY